MIKHSQSFLGGFVAGMFAMYDVDAHSGGRRRALLRFRPAMALTGTAWH
jgi:hypothetical protein